MNSIKRAILPPLLVLLHFGCARTVVTSKSIDLVKTQNKASSLPTESQASTDRSDRNYQSSARRHFNTGLEHVKKGENQRSDYQLAVLEFSEAVSIKPDFEEAHLNLGLAYLNLENFEKALEQFEGVKKRNKGSLHRKALYNIGISYIKMGRLAAAAKRFETLSTDGNYAAAIILGDIHSRQGRTDIAISDFKRAAELSPKKPEAYKKMGSLYMRSQDKPNTPAINSFLKALKLQPGDTDSYFNLGVLYYQAGEIDKSVNMFRKVTMLSADAGAAYYNLGLIQYQDNDLKNAIMYLTLAKSYNYSPAIIALTQIYLDGNQIDTALSLVNQFIAANTDYAEAYCSLGAILQKAGRVYEAKTAYLSALKLSPENIMALNNLAVIYRETGEFDKALDTNYKILKISPDFPYAHKNLGIIYDIFLNDYKVAKYHYAEYLRIGPVKDDDVKIWLKEMDERGKS